MSKKIDKSPILRTRLRRVLQQKGVAASHVSRFAGFNETVIKNIFQAKSKNPRAETIDRLERTLGLPLGFLLATREDTQSLADSSATAERLRFEARERGETFDHEADLQDEAFWGEIHHEELEPYVNSVDELNFIQSALATPELFDPDGLPVDISQAPAQTPVVGEIGAGGHINPIDDHAKGGGLDYVDTPVGAKPNTVGAIVRGTSFYPLLPDGSLVFWSRLESSINDWLYKMVVCHLEDGRKMVKVLTPGTAQGRYTLTSPSAPPIENVVLANVSPIDLMQPKN